MIFLHGAAFLAAFAILFKCADLFVDGASRIATILNIPKLLIGIVLVGLATTAPEFAVSVIAAIQGLPEIALGNAIGSVIVDDCVALALAAILAPTVIFINCRMLRVIGVFLLGIDFLAYLLARDGVLSRWEGLILVSMLGVYFLLIFKVRSFRTPGMTDNGDTENSAGPRMNAAVRRDLKRPVTKVLIGLAGVILTAEVIVQSAVYIARFFDIPEIIIGSTLVAVGTSLPEVSTCITAALKGEGELAVGNILGADVLNILWIIGVASLTNPIIVDREIINFKFPYMILVVTVMLVLMRIGCRLSRAKGFILLGFYLLYLFLTFHLFL
jgi:cation:H+ antiporter